jgi:hypothetical protein
MSSAPRQCYLRSVSLREAESYFYSVSVSTSVPESYVTVPYSVRVTGRNGPTRSSRKEHSSVYCWHHLRRLAPIVFAARKGLTAKSAQDELKHGDNWNSLPNNDPTDAVDQAEQTDTSKKKPRKNAKKTGRTSKWRGNKRRHSGGLADLRPPTRPVRVRKPVVKYGEFLPR